MQPGEKLKAKIKSFWEWFMDNETLFKEVITDPLHEDRENLIQAMDNHILEFGMFKWEMGQIENQFFFTISPNRNHEFLKISKTVVKAAPNLAHWIFNYAKPIKKTDLQFNLFDDFMVEHFIDPLLWICIVLPLKNHKARIIIEAKNLEALDEETQLTACQFTLTNLIGEERYMNSIGKIEIVQELNSDDRELCASILEIEKKLNDLQKSITLL